VNALEQMELGEEATPDSTERPTPEGKGENNDKSPALREVLRTLNHLDERAAIFSLLAQLAIRHFCPRPGAFADYNIERRDGSVSAANLDVVLALSMDLHRLEDQAREQAAALLKAAVDVSSVPAFGDLNSDDEDSTTDEREAVPSAVPRT
jgi:hypothetical protein